MTRVNHGDRIVGAVLAVTTLAACGAPTHSPAEVIATVPYGLASPSASVEPAPAATPSHGSHVYLVRDNVLVPASPPPSGTDARSSAVRALGRLMEGPTEQDRTAGMSTALGPDVRLALVDLSSGRATVDIRAGEPAPGAARLPLAVGQVVLTLASVEGVQEVVLTSDGTRIAAPLPGGALTDQPLKARDYAELTVAPTPAGSRTPAPT